MRVTQKIESRKDFWINSLRAASTPTSFCERAMRFGPRTASLNPDPVLRAYVIGLAIGDGGLSNPNGRAVRLRITCDIKYPLLIEKYFLP